MDSFIDRLAHRFTAQEIIKANATAEAEELKRTREQVRQYEICLEEMKQVNESMKETLGKLEEQLNSNCAEEEGGKLSAEDLQEINKMLDDVLVEIQNTKEISVQQQNELAEQLTVKIQEMQASVAEQMQVVQDGIFGQVGQMLEERDGMTGLVQEIQDGMAEQLQELQAQVSAIQESVSGQMGSIQDAQDKLSGQLVMQMHDVQTMQEIQSKIPGHISSQMQSAKEQILAQLKLASEQENSNMFSDIQIALLKELNNSQAEVTKEQMATKLSEQKEQLTDYIHKESVKVYRNVQAVVVDESNKQSEAINFSLSKVTAKNQLMLRLVIASCICSGASLVAVVVLILKSLNLF